MTKYKYEHVEDYIEIIAGYRELDGKRPSGMGGLMTLFGGGTPIISLARYDMKIIPSLAEQTIGATGKGYTDRQAKLAADLVIKYERQLAKLGLDISPLLPEPKYRLPIRKIDRTSRAWVEGDIIKLRFPYNVDQIEKVRAAAKESKGTIKFNKDLKIQELSLTEWNVNWVHSFCQINSFTIDPSLQQLMDMIVEAEQTPHAIELTFKDNELSITNAPTSMIEYIDATYGGVNTDNILTLIDLAPILGYTIAEDVKDTVVNELGARFWNLCSCNQLKINATATNASEVITDIAKYAKAANRFPIFIYEPDLSERLLKDFEQHFPGQVTKLGNKKSVEIEPDTKIIYATKIPRQPFDRIPLMISSAGMLYGGDRQLWIQTAEKIVYFSKDVYNKNNKGPKICEPN